MALKIWLPLNGNINNNGLTENNAVINGNVPFSNGKIGKAADFTGKSATNRITVPGLELTTFSVCAWFMVPQAVTAASCIINEGRDYNTLGWRMYITSANKISLNCANTAYNTLNCTTNTWYHACITFGDGTVKYYINGELKLSVNTSVLPDYSESNGYINIGAFGYSTNNTFIYPFNGYINDVRVYDEVLSDKQIKEIAKGLCAHYKLEGVGANKNLLTNSHVENRNHSSTSYPCAAYPLGSSVTANKKYTVSVNATFTDAYVIALYFGGGSYGTQWVDCSQNGTYTLSWTFTANSNMAAQNFVNVYVRDADNTPKIGIAKCIVHWIKLEEGEIKTSWIPNEADSLYTELDYNKVLTTDVSGFGYNGTQSGTLTFNIDSPRYAGSTYFNGPGYLHYLSSPLNSSTDAFTFTCWFYPTQASNMALYNDRTVVGSGFSVFYLGGALRFDTGSNSEFQFSNDTSILNKWSFIACTYDRNNGIKKAYINGIQVGSTTSIGDLAQIGTYASIGNSSTNGAAGAGNQIYGSLSDVRIYSTALSAEDILKLYEISGIIDNKGNVYAYEFKEE